jgi:hypothetical protein
MRTVGKLQFFGETGNQNDVTVSIFWEDCSNGNDGTNTIF